jgi:copper chaperone CopZ
MSLIQSVQLSIPSMTCASCRGHVYAALKEVDGVKKIDIRLAERKAIVEYDILVASSRDLQQALEEADYPNDIISPEAAREFA